MDYSYIGSGKVYLREAGAAAGLIEVGNCSALNFSVTEDEKTLRDYTKGGGGAYNEVRIVTAVEVSMTLHDLSASNLARVLYGETSEVAEASVTNEEHVGYKGGFVPFNFIPKATVAPVVEAAEGLDAGTRANATAYALGDYLVPAVANGYFYKVTTAGTSAGSPPTFGTTVGGTTTDGTATLTNMGKVALVADTDYTFENGGISLAAAAAFTDGETLRIDYTKVGQDVVQALLNSGKEWELFFDGLNEARSGKRTRVHAYRTRIGATQSMPLIGEDYAGLEVSGKVLKDTTKNGTSVSQYFKTDIEQ